MAPSEMVQASEVQIYERTLYKVPRGLHCAFPGAQPTTFICWKRVQCKAQTILLL